MQPIYVGNLVFFEADLTYVGRTSMEVRVQVFAENPLTGERRNSNTAYLVYVALDSDGNPQPVPELIYETEEEELLYEQAKVRQEFRNQQRRQEKNNP